MDLVKDPNPAGSLTRSTTLKISCHQALEQSRSSGAVAFLSPRWNREFVIDATPQRRLNAYRLLAFSFPKGEEVSIVELKLHAQHVAVKLLIRGHSSLVDCRSVGAICISVHGDELHLLV